MATAELRSSFAPLMGGTAYRASKFDTPYGLRPDVEKKDVTIKQEPERLPKIVLRDSAGHQLNTFTTLQEAIYRAELNVRKSRIGATAQEWRLPHGPLPAKPDYSRAGPTISTYRQKINNLKSKNRRVARSFPEYPIYKEVDVDDVAFVAESLNHLPQVPSLSFLRQEFLAQPKRYYPIVNSILLHQKLLSETDKRDPEYTFPGFCFGCRQHMLCPGCDRTSKPHYHLDKLYKTTGGLPQARTLQEELKKHYGDNWRLTLPDLLVRKTSKVPSLTKEERQLIEEELDRNLRSGSEQGQKNFLPPIPSASGRDERKEDAGTASGSIDTEDEGILADRQSLGFNDDDTHTLSSHDQDRGRRGSRGQSSDYDIDKDSDSEDLKYKGIGPRSRTAGSGQETDDDEDMSGYASSQRTERKGRLYKAPAAFKLKQRKKRMLKTQSPFTADRNLNLPTGPGFKLKQNSKNTTKFVDFDKKDHAWKEPSKFELQKSGKDGTKFWSPKSQKKKKHEKHGRHTSPDSGLDSDKMTAKRKGLFRKPKSLTRRTNLARIKEFSPRTDNFQNLIPLHKQSNTDCEEEYSLTINEASKIRNLQKLYNEFASSRGEMRVGESCSPEKALRNMRGAMNQIEQPNICTGSQKKSKVKLKGDRGAQKTVGTENNLAAQLSRPVLLRSESGAISPILYDISHASAWTHEGYISMCNRLVPFRGSYGVYICFLQRE